MESYDELIQKARSRVRSELAPIRSELTGEEVQLSVRLPAGLRAAVAEVAARRKQSVTAFVTETLERAVQEAADPFAALAAELARQTRAVLAEAVDSRAYAEAAGQVDAAERESAAG
jgi:small-conductance mechanosensitive channel